MNRRTWATNVWYEAYRSKSWAARWEVTREALSFTGVSLAIAAGLCAFASVPVAVLVLVLDIVPTKPQMRGALLGTWVGVMAWAGGRSARACRVFLEAIQDETAPGVTYSPTDPCDELPRPGRAD